VVIQEVESHNKADLLLFSNKHTVYKMKLYEIDDCKASSLGDYLVNVLHLDSDEKIIYIVATDDYKGYMLFAYENGKIAKIHLNSYATKTNRKKLANAYSDIDKLVHMQYLAEDMDLVAISSINKVLVFNTSSINPKASRDSQGVQVLASKKNSRMVAVKTLEQVRLNDVDYYRTKNIPAVGCYLKENDSIDGKVQMRLDEVE